jgi:iron(III) transport system ATP-binding protein
MVFQSYALWPHLTVAQNVAYGLEVRGVAGAEREARVAEALRAVQMEAYGSRTPNQLSGGQQQRVALARALVIRPDVLLLDEPLSNLDARLRLEMREEIRRLHDRTRITTIYVTHDQKESLSMADRMAVLREGAIEQIGSPREVYCAPASRFVAEFIGETNWLEAEVEEAGPSRLVLRTRSGRLTAGAHPGFSGGQAVWLGFRPEAVRIGAGTDNSLDTRIVQVTYLGEIEQYLLELGSGTRVKAFEQNPMTPRRAGEPLAVNLRPENLFVLRREPESAACTSS